MRDKKNRNLFIKDYIQDKWLIHKCRKKIKIVYKRTGSGLKQA